MNDRPREREAFGMFVRAAKYCLRFQWLKIVVIIFLVLLYAVVCLAGRDTIPVSYADVEAMYGEYADPEGRLADRAQVPPGLRGLSIQEAHAQLLERHTAQVLSITLLGEFWITPVLTGALAWLLISRPRKKHRLIPPSESGCGRGTVYLFLAVLYFGLMLLIWVIAVPFLLGKYPIALSSLGPVWYRELKLSLLLSLLFGAALAFFFAILLRRPILGFLAPLVVWYLLMPLSSVVPLPILPLSSIASAEQWEGGKDVLFLAVRCCVTAVTLAAAVAGGWRLFKRGDGGKMNTD